MFPSSAIKGFLTLQKIHKYMKASDYTKNCVHKHTVNIVTSFLFIVGWIARGLGRKTLGSMIPNNISIATHLQNQKYMESR